MDLILLLYLHVVMFGFPLDVQVVQDDGLLSLLDVVNEDFEAAVCFHDHMTATSHLFEINCF